MTTKPNLKFDHDPRAGSAANCPSEKCADRSRRLTWVDRFDWGETLNLDLKGVHFSTSTDGQHDKAAAAIYRPSDDLLQSLVMVCMGELERRQELRDQRNAPLSCNCYSGGKDECPAHGAKSEPANVSKPPRVMPTVAQPPDPNERWNGGAQS